MIKMVIFSFIFLSSSLFASQYEASNENINDIVSSMRSDKAGNTKSNINELALSVLKMIYDAPDVSCDDKPGYDCNGFFLTAFEQPNDYWLHPDPKTNRMSYTFMLKNTATNPFSNAGVILIPTSIIGQFPNAQRPTLHCAYPVDGMTADRDDYGCGEYLNIASSKPCQDQGILTADDWLGHYDTNKPDIFRQICGFAINGDIKNNIMSYNAIHDIIVKSNIRQKNIYPWNEYDFYTWKADKPNSVPVFAFFFMPSYQSGKIVKHNINRKEIKGAFRLEGDPRDLAMKEQLLFYKESGLYAPVIRIYGHFPNVTYSIFDADQSPEIPDAGLTWGPVG